MAGNLVAAIEGSPSLASYPPRRIMFAKKLSGLGNNFENWLFLIDSCAGRRGPSGRISRTRNGSVRKLVFYCFFVQSGAFLADMVVWRKMATTALRKSVHPKRRIQSGWRESNRHLSQFAHAAALTDDVRRRVSIYSSCVFLRHTNYFRKKVGLLAQPTGRRKAGAIVRENG